MNVLFIDAYVAVSSVKNHFRVGVLDSLVFLFYAFQHMILRRGSQFTALSQGSVTHKKAKPILGQGFLGSEQIPSSQ